MTVKNALIEAGKELARVAILSAIPLLISGLESGIIDWKLIAVAVSISVLRAVDRFVHEYDEMEANGVIPF